MKEIEIEDSLYEYILDNNSNVSNFVNNILKSYMQATNQKNENFDMYTSHGNGD